MRFVWVLAHWILYAVSGLVLLLMLVAGDGFDIWSGDGVPSAATKLVSTLSGIPLFVLGLGMTIGFEAPYQAPVVGASAALGGILVLVAWFRLYRELGR